MLTVPETPALNTAREVDVMNTPAHHAVTARRGYGAAVKWCVALACAAYGYGLLEPAATARARLDACVNENLARRDSEVGAAAATAAGETEREQAFGAAVYACSTQP
jgi:hypothetical protein